MDESDDNVYYAKDALIKWRH